MKNYFLSGLSEYPRGNRSLASQIGYTFVILLIVLLVITSSVSDAYTSILKEDRSDTLLALSASEAAAAAHLQMEDGMSFPLPAPTYTLGRTTYSYTINLYTKAGNSFLLVYTSAERSPTESEQQVTLTGAGEGYQLAFDQQKSVVARRTDSDGSYVAGISPVIGKEGTVVGIIEVLMPAAHFSYTETGLSLSWLFTMISIAVAICMVYYETHKLLNTMFTQPDRQLPKIIRYGLSGCQSIAFFSAMACSMPPLIIVSFVLTHAPTDLGDVRIKTILVGISAFLFAWGFFGFQSLRSYLVRQLTTRVALVASVFASFLLLIPAAIFRNVYLYMALLLPAGFFLGMVFYFQREYRIYASRLGYENFSERVIHSTQTTGFFLGASVGAVIAGIIYERFGLLSVSLMTGLTLFLVAIQALLFIQHCPPSPEPAVHLPALLSELSAGRSGAFLWSGIVTLGIQIPFFFLFIPELLHSLAIPLATVAFYYILFFLVGSVLLRLLLLFLPAPLGLTGRILISAVLQLVGFLALAFVPSAKMLVVVVALFALSLSLHEFRYLEFFQGMSQRKPLAYVREVIERALTLGVFIGTIAFSSVFLFYDLTIPLLIFALFDAVLLFAYPVRQLLQSSDPHSTPSGENRSPDRSEQSQNRNLAWGGQTYRGNTDEYQPINPYTTPQSPYPDYSANYENPSAPYPYANPPTDDPYTDQDVKIYSPPPKRAPEDDRWPGSGREGR